MEFKEVKEGMENIFKKYQPTVKKTGQQLTKAVKEAEEEIARMYKLAQTQLEIQMTNLQKEKLYHAIGKEAAGMMLRGELEIPAFNKYLEKLKDIDKLTHKKKNSIVAIGRTKRKKAAKKKS